MKKKKRAPKTKKRAPRKKKSQVPVKSASTNMDGHIGALLMWIVDLDDETRRRLFWKLQRRYDFDSGMWILKETEPPKLYCSECGKPQVHSPSGITCRNGHGDVEGITLEALAQRKKKRKR